MIGNEQSGPALAKSSTVLVCYAIYFLVGLFGTITAIYKYLHRLHPQPGVYAGLIAFPGAFIFFVVSLAGAMKSGPPTQRKFQTSLRWGMVMMLIPIFINTVTP